METLQGSVIACLRLVYFVYSIHTFLGDVDFLFDFGFFASLTSQTISSFSGIEGMLGIPPKSYVK
jgi:hypothetical protein